MGGTLFDKIWDAHVVGRRVDGRDLLYIDRHVLHELHAPHAFKKLKAAGRKVRRPDLTFSALDHTPASKPGRGRIHQSRRKGVYRCDARGKPRKRRPRLRSERRRARHFACGGAGNRNGVARRNPRGARQPRLHGWRLGALAFGCGTTELEHVLATQVLALVKPKRMRVTLTGKPGAHASAKDVALKILAEIGVSGGRGHAIEFAGELARALPSKAA